VLAPDGSCTPGTRLLTIPMQVAPANREDVPPAIRPAGRSVRSVRFTRSSGSLPAERIRTPPTTYKLHTPASDAGLR